MIVNPGRLPLAVVAARRTPQDPGAPKLVRRKARRFAVTGAAGSGLAAAISRHAPEILQAWDTTAASLAHTDRPLDVRQLRDNAAGILARIVRDLCTPEGPARATGEDDALAAPAQHGASRREAGFTLGDTVAEYAALRASVLRICAATVRIDLSQVLAFDAAVDAALALAVRRYETQTKAATDLFLGVLAHEIRNPLGTILNRTELALLTGQTTPGRGMPVINAARRIQGIVEQTADFTRLQSFGALPMVRKFDDLGVLLAKVVEETLLREPGATIRFEADGDLWGWWDAGRLAQVLSNLLANAITYGSRDSAITVRVWSTPDEAFMSVHNHGAPISPEETARIFDALFRGGGAERRARAGLGLGLYICREIVRSHGGHLWVESALDAGTRFTARLAREQDPVEPARASVESWRGLQLRT